MKVREEERDLDTWGNALQPRCVEYVCSLAVKISACGAGET